MILQLSSLPVYSVGARVDSPGIGRFLARDTLGFHDYSYAANNPVSFRDPSGLDPALQGDSLDSLDRDMGQPLRLLPEHEAVDEGAEQRIRSVTPAADAQHRWPD